MGNHGLYSLSEKEVYLPVDERKLFGSHHLLAIWFQDGMNPVSMDSVLFQNAGNRGYRVFLDPLI